MQDAEWIALIRTIGGTTHARMSMADLRAAAQAAGLGHVRTVLATGNLLFISPRPGAEIKSVLSAILSGFGLENEVFLRSAAELQAVIDANPLPDAAKQRPNHLLVSFMAKAPGKAEATAAMQHGGPETVILSGREVYVDYCNGVARSKLTPARLERLLGRSGTARNWNTLVRLVKASSRN